MRLPAIRRRIVATLGSAHVGSGAPADTVAQAGLGDRGCSDRDESAWVGAGLLAAYLFGIVPYAKTLFRHRPADARSEPRSRGAGCRPGGPASP